MFFLRRAGGPPEWLLVFLGNPGSKYEYTRHNIAWLAADVLSARLRAPIRKVRHHALTAQSGIGGRQVLMMKPTTYMNLSGEAVGAASRFYKIPPERILVVSDETALPLGKLRLRASGSAGGHNGLKSIIFHLGTDNFPRLRIGVGGKPHPDYDMADWVLGKFTGGDLKNIAPSLDLACDAIELAVTRDVQSAMAKYN